MRRVHIVEDATGGNDHDGMGFARDPASRRVIDIAIGILTGLRGCGEQDAFDELVTAVHETGAGALAGLARGSEAPHPHSAVATARWGHLIADRAASMHGATD